MAVRLEAQYMEQGVFKDRKITLITLITFQQESSKNFPDPGYSFKK